MHSHPNYVGYDATEGNPRGRQAPKKVALPVASSPLKKSDFNKELRPGWIKKLEAVRLWCGQNGASFSVSPHDYQLAKIKSEHSNIVLWSGRAKPSKTPIIKATFEGPVRHHTHSQTALAAIQAMVA